MKHLGLRIRIFRKVYRLSQAKLSERACISPQYLSQIENGKKKFSVFIFMDIAAALGVSPAELIGGESPESSQNPQMAAINEIYEKKKVLLQLQGRESPRMKELAREIAEMLEELWEAQREGDDQAPRA